MSTVAKPVNKRSRNGCKTCKRRRRKCDERRPKCLRCAADGIPCEGYNISLVWRVEAQRVIPPQSEKYTFRKPTSSLESLERSATISTLLKAANIQLDSLERAVLDEFMSTGRYDLHSRDHDTPPLEEFIASICSSRAAVDACLAMEFAMRKEKDKMMHYFTDALAKFREVLHNLNDADYPGVLAAAVLICCCAFCTQQPWRFHLNGILAIVEMCQPKYIEHPGVDWSLQCMCLYDMDILRISGDDTQQTKLLWQHYCMDKQEGIQAVTGIPMSLMHLISSLRWHPDESINLAYVDLEPKLWSWNAEEPPTALDNSIWDSWRYAALVLISIALKKPETSIHILIARVMSAVKETTWYCSRFSVKIPNSIFWPTLVVATCPYFRNCEQAFVREMWQDDGCMLATRTLRLTTNRRAWDLMQEVWRTGKKPQEIVQSHGWTEMCLL